MPRFFNKSSASFIASFLLMVLASLGLLVGLSAYAEAKGVELPAAVARFLEFFLL